MSKTNTSNNTRDALPSWCRKVSGRTHNCGQCGVQSIFCTDRCLPLQPHESARDRRRCGSVEYQTRGSSPSKVWKEAENNIKI